MKGMPVSNVRNFALMGHTGSGKTTLVDALLFRFGVTDRKLGPDTGTSLADYTEEERERKISVWAKPMDGVFKAPGGESFRMVMIDTPGYADFVGQTLAALEASDSVLVVVDATSGLQVGSNRAWRLAEKAGKPRAVVLSGLDKENANPEGVLASLREAWGARCLPVSLPVEGGRKVIDLFSKEADAHAEAEGFRNQIIEAAAETNDALLEKYLGGEPLSAEEMNRGLRTAVNNGTLFPVFMVSSKTEAGLAEFCDGVVRYLPSPLERSRADADGHPIDPSPSAPFVGFVWRTIVDPFVGHLSLVRVLGGTLKPEGDIQNVTQGQKERLGLLLFLNGKKQDPTAECQAGDVVAIPKLKHTALNHTLCAIGHTARLEPVLLPNPVVFFSVMAKTQGDEDKLAGGLARVAEQDPTLHVERHAATHELVLAGMGDVQINIAVENMKKVSHVEVDLHTPKVAYKETITGRSEGHYKHKKQSGGRGQYGEVYLRVAPKAAGDAEWFENAVVGGTIPSNFIPAVQKGLVEGLLRGALAGYPVENVKVTVYDGSYHDVDSSEVAFKIAGSRALRDALGKAKPMLLEPIMKMRIRIPEHCMGDVTGDLNHKRGRILGMDSEDGMQVIIAEIPQAEVFQYSSQLRSVTGGRGSFDMELSRMDTVPSAVAQKVIAEAQKHHQEEEV
jgi:elongation factor G